MGYDNDSLIDSKCELLKQTRGTQWEMTARGMIEWGMPVADIWACLRDPRVMALFAQCFDTSERRANGGRELACSFVERTTENCFLLDCLNFDGLLRAVVDLEECEQLYAFSISQIGGR